MRTIAINAVNSNSGGGKSIRDSYIKLLNEQPLKDRYVLFVAKEASLPPVTNPNIEIMKLPTFYSRAIAVPLVYRYLLGRILDRIGANVVLNFGNLIIRTEAKQIAVFHWPYGVDVHKKVWMGMTPTDWLTRKTKLWFLERYFREADIVVALSESHERVFEERLQPIAGRGMEDIAFAQSMRQLRAYELVIATLGAAAADKSSGAVVGEAWKLLWLARGNAEQGAEELRRFSKFANADPVPRSKKLRRRAELADLVRLSTTLPAFFLKKPVKRKAS